MSPRSQAARWCLCLVLASAGARAEQGALEATVDSGAEASAETPGPPARRSTGFEHSLRLGASLPSGNIAEGRSLADEVDLRVPVWVDIGYRVGALTLALYAQVGLYAEGDQCAARFARPNVACNAEDVRLGFEGLLHFPVAGLDGWLGVGVGWEILEQRARFVIPASDPTDPFSSDTFVDIRESQQGPTLDLQAGADLVVDGSLRAGPFASYTLGSYLDRSLRCPAAAAGACGNDDLSLAAHHWFTVGVRGTYGP